MNFDGENGNRNGDYGDGDGNDKDGNVGNNKGDGEDVEVEAWD